MIEIDNILDVEKHLTGISAVVFDLDDTLYSEREYVRSGYRAVANCLSRPDLEEKMWEAFLRGGQAIDEVLTDAGIPERKAEALLTYRYHTPSIHLYPGVAEMLKRIRKDHKIGIITDGRPEGQHAKITVLGLADLVDKIIITDELGSVEFRKPNALAFQLMQEKLSIPFEQMVYVGDNMKKDFVAPNMLGMKAVLFRNRDGLYL